jgi:hypothetical protein
MLEPSEIHASHVVGSRPVYDTRDGGTSPIPRKDIPYWPPVRADSSSELDSLTIIS